MSAELTRHPVLWLDQVLIRRNFWVVFGATYRLFDLGGSLVATSRQKAFRLREDIRIYADEARTQEILTMSARQIIDFSAAYDIIDATTGEKVGATRRRGFKSIFKDEWQLLDADDNQIGTIKEDNATMAFLRRFLSNLIPQTFVIDHFGTAIGSVRQHFNPFIFKATMDLSADQERALDRRLAVGAVMLLLAIEGRQR